MGWFTSETEIHTWQDAEQNAARLMRAWGYQGAKVTAVGADGGIDVTARGAVAQVKHHRRPVGRPDLQRLVGAADGASMLFFAWAGYTEHAVEYALRHNIALFQYDVGGTAQALNGQARKVGKLGGSQGFDRLDRMVLAVAPGLKPYVEQRGWWSTAVLGIGGAIIVPVNYGSDLGILKTVLAVVGLGLVSVIAVAGLIGKDEPAERRKEDPSKNDTTSPDVAESARALELDSKGNAQEIAHKSAAGSETPPVRPMQREPLGPGRLGGIWPEGILGLVVAAIPLLTLRWNGGGWWWIPYGFAWFLCWIFALAMFMNTGMRVHDRRRVTA